jgi:replicative DNA helicase
MERIFRSIIQVGAQPETEDCNNNWQRLQDYVLERESEDDEKIFKYVKMFYDQMSAPPDYTLVKEFFEKEDDTSVVSRLEEIRAVQFYIRTNFIAIARSIQDRQQVKNFVLLMRDASAIAEHGRNLEKPIAGKKTLKGVPDAMSLIAEKMPQFSRVEAGERLEGVVHDDAGEVIEEYETLVKSGQFNDRNLLGLEPVDMACKGHRKGEIWFHCAAPGHLKTSLALNYAYNNTVVYKKNILYVILEMPYSQLRKQLYAIHSSHGKFVTEWNKDDNYVGINYQKIRDGELTPKEFERFKIVANDFQKSTEGRLYIWRPADDVNIDDIRRKAEGFHYRFGCDGIIIDHLGLVTPKRRNQNYVVEVNQIVRDTRMLALNFARGHSVPILALFQINRQGQAKADKNGGIYDNTAISYANEVEKSADKITYTYLNPELRNKGLFLVGCLKNRDDPLFEPILGKIIWPTKRMRHLESDIIDVEIRDRQSKPTISSISFDDMMGNTGTFG